MNRYYFLSILIISLSLVSISMMISESSGVSNKVQESEEVEQFSKAVKISPSSSSPPNSNKVTICHNPQENSNNPKTISISENALPSHLEHNDIIGPCGAQAGQSQDTTFSTETRTTSQDLGRFSTVSTSQDTTFSTETRTTSQDSGRYSTESRTTSLATPTAHTTGNPLFTEVGAAAGVDFQHSRANVRWSVSGGAAVFDFNNDGLQDIFVTNSGGANALYRNDGNMMFTDIAVSAGVDDPVGLGTGFCSGDYDNDGYVDLYLTNYGTSKLFRNNGDETFADVTATAQVGDVDPTYHTTGCAWGDYNNDSYLDLIVVRWASEIYNPDGTYASDWDLNPLSFFTNNGDGTFTNDIALLPGDPNIPGSTVRRGGFQPVFVDYDNDGDVDIYICNDTGRIPGPNTLFQNDGAGPTGWLFSDVSASTNTDDNFF